MKNRLVIGLDSSTQSTKAIAWSAAGDMVAEGRADIPMSTPRRGYFEQDPNAWWAAACTALKEVCAQIDLTCVDGLAISNQRETMGYFNHDLSPAHPAIVWLDNRSVGEVEELAGKIGEVRFHEITGKPKDVTPGHSRILWLKKNRPEMMQDAPKILDVNAYLTARLTGEATTSWASADPSGVFDIEKKQWSGTVLDAIGVVSEQFAKPVAPGTLIGEILPQAVEQTGLPRGTHIYAGGGDGQCAALGVNALGKGRVYLNLGTAIVTGSWSETPQISQAWRTMTSPTGAGYILEGVMRSGTFFMDWFVENYVSRKDRGATHQSLQTAAQALPIGTDGLLVCPFLTGCMNPFWDMNARAAFFGVSPDHDAVHLYRGAMEALTGEIARTISGMQDKGLEINEIIAVGGGANSALWRQMLVDATNLPMTLSKSLEASSLGAGMIAAVGAGWFDSIEQAAETMSATGERFQANPGAHENWQSLLSRQQRFNDFCCHNPLIG